MEHYKVVFLQDALDDLEEIVLYIAHDSKANAAKTRDKAIDVANHLKIFSKLGVLVPNKKIAEHGFRMIIVEKYIVFYKIYTDEINILRILHGSRDYKTLFNKKVEQ